MSIHLNPNGGSGNLNSNSTNDSGHLNGREIVQKEGESGFLAERVEEISSNPTFSTKTFEARPIRDNSPFNETFPKDFSGSALVAQNDEIIFSKVFGDLAGTKEELIYRWCSITKSITATAVLQLVESGKINLNDPITKYLKEYQDETQYPGLAGVTVKELLSHTSRAPDHPDYLAKLIDPTLTLSEKNQIEEDYYLGRQTPEEMVENIMKLSLKSEPYKYNNFGFTVLGLLVERLTGSYEQYVQKNIFDRAEMKTACVATTRQNDLANAEGFYLDKKGAYHKALIDDPMVRFASGNINGSTLDLFRFDRALKKGTLLGSEMLKIMREARIGFDASGQVAGKKMVSKGGSMEGIRTLYQQFPEEDTTIILLGNSDLDVYPIAEKMATELFGFASDKSY